MEHLVQKHITRLSTYGGNRLAIKEGAEKQETLLVELPSLLHHDVPRGDSSRVA